jgi:hypothetical protein
MEERIYLTILEFLKKKKKKNRWCRNCRLKQSVSSFFLFSTKSCSIKVLSFNPHRWFLNSKCDVLFFTAPGSQNEMGAQLGLF